MLHQSCILTRIKLGAFWIGWSEKDTSSLKRTQDKATAPRDVIAVPDFVITRNGYVYDGNQNPADTLGCIEVKYQDADVTSPSRLGNATEKRGYLEVYHKVIYTNGWIWRFYDASQQYKEIDFRNNASNSKYGELLNMLCSIEW